jgi:regulatory protein
MKKPKPLDLNGLMNYAAQALSARAQSLSEMRTRLKRRAAKQEDVAEVLSRLKQAGLMDDIRFADSFANWRRENQGLGKARVVRDLMVRRVAPAVAKKAVDRAYAEVDETGLIESFLNRKFRGKNLGELLREPKNLASAYRKLRLAGFSSGNSIGVLKRYAAEADRLAELGDEMDEEMKE